MIEMFYSVGTYQTGRPNPSGTPVNQAMQMGLISSESVYLFDSVTSSFYLAFLNTGHDDTVRSHFFEVNFYDENSIVDSSIGNREFSSNNFYHIRTAYTNSGTGLFDVDLDIDEYGSGNLVSAPLLDGNFVTASLSALPHNFSAGELSALHPGLGIHQDEAGVSALSGASFDSVPEPSSAMLTLVASFFGWRRRR